VISDDLFTLGKPTDDNSLTSAYIENRKKTAADDINYYQACIIVSRSDGQPWRHLFILG